MMVGDATDLPSAPAVSSWPKCPGALDFTRDVSNGTPARADPRRDGVLLF